MSNSLRRSLLLPFVLLSVLVCSLSACVAAPVKPPESELFSKLSAPDASMPAPAVLPDRPLAMVLSALGADYMAFDPVGAKQLMVRDALGEQNTVLASECSAGFNEMSSAYASLLRQAQDHERMYNLVGVKWAEAETQLQRQDVVHEVESWAQRALMVIAVGLAL